MTKPSDCWSNSDWNEFAQKRPRFANIKPDRIPIVASKLRSRILCKLSSGFTSGSFNAIFEIEFDDAIIWICRIRHTDPRETLTYLKLSTESTVTGMQYARQHTNIPVPEIYAFESNPNNELGGSYMFMEPMTGEHRCTPGPEQNLGPSEIEFMYAQIAEGTIQMAQLTFPKIGRIYCSNDGQFDIGPFVHFDGTTHGPFSTSVAFYAYIAETNTGPESWIKDKYAAHLYRLAARKLTLGNEGPFRLCHGDYGGHNILFDDKCTISGIVDWDFVYAAPPLSCCIWPALLQVRWFYVPKNGISESLLARQKAYVKGVKVAEQKYTTSFDGQLISSVVGSDQATVAQIIQILDLDWSYKDYDGRRVFEFIFGEASYDQARELFFRENHSEYL